MDRLNFTSEAPFPKSGEGSPLSLWPESTRRQYERRLDGLQRALERLEDLREWMVTKLDQLECDADLEPSLGSGELDLSLYTRRGLQSLDQRQWARGASDDREGPDDDLEPSLASLRGTAASSASQKQWSYSTGGLLDGEDEHDGCEPEEDANTGDEEPDTHHLPSPPYVGDHDQTRFTGPFAKDLVVGAR